MKFTLKTTKQETFWKLEDSGVYKLEVEDLGKVLPSYLQAVLKLSYSK
jgi:hypothetical protein